MRLRQSALLLLLLPLLGLPSCMQRTDADLKVTSRAENLPVKWVKAGEWGGTAQLTLDSPDPYAKRYTPGQFLRIAGLCVTDTEVWVCDMDLSRIQIFDYSGNLLRTIGCGAPIEGTLISDQEMLEEALAGKKVKVHWDEGEGKRWVGAERELFRAADVEVRPDGYYVADWAQSRANQFARRKGGVLFVPNNGGPPEALKSGNLFWTRYLSYANGILAASAPQCNRVQLIDVTKPYVQNKLLGSDPALMTLLKLHIQFHGHKDYVTLERKLTEASYAPLKFNNPGGIALAFNKLVVCDTANYRLQAFEAQNHGQYWGKLLRIILSKRIDGAVRFEGPRDIAVAASGQMFVLDAGRHEVGLLDSTFNRLGTFGKGELAEPLAIGISPDAKHCFVTDGRSNKVLHYVAQD